MTEIGALAFAMLCLVAIVYVVHRLVEARAVDQAAAAAERQDHAALVAALIEEAHEDRVTLIAAVMADNGLQFGHIVQQAGAGTPTAEDAVMAARQHVEARRAASEWVDPETSEVLMPVGLSGSQ